MDQEPQYDIGKDWKFLSIVQFSNVFKNVLAIDPISTYELSFSLRNSDIEPMCMNVLLKLLMKKTLFKATSKIGENFEIAKFNEILIKKINFLYKTYLRYLKRVYTINDPSQIFEIIKQDIDAYNSKNDTFKLTTSNLMDKSYEDFDLKTLMVVNFFREVGGFNPLQKAFTKEKMEQLLNQDVEAKEMIEMTTAAVNNANNNEIVLEDYLSFADLDLKKKIDFLYFFCNYAITFSGRAPFFKEELTKTSDDMIKESKKILPLGYDNDGVGYYTFPLNKECKLYKEVCPNEFEECVKDYADLETFIENDSSQSFINKIKERLLQFKENDEEQYKKEQGLLRKQEAFEKAKKLSAMNSVEINKYPNNDFLLMNMSNHIITRHQLIQMTKNNQINQPSNAKVHELTEEEKRKQKVEKENLERERRMQKRNIIQEKNKMRETQRQYHQGLGQKPGQFHHKNKPSSQRDGNYLNNKRKRPKQNYSSSDEDEYGDSSEKSSLYVNEDEMQLESDNENDDGNNNNNRTGNGYERHHTFNIHHDNNNEQDCTNNNDDGQMYPMYNDEGNDIGEDMMYNNNDDNSNDIINEGYLIYRYSNNQIELEGNWFVVKDPEIKERVSYLFSCQHIIKDFTLSKDELIIDNDDIKQKMASYGIMGGGNVTNGVMQPNDYRMRICPANLFECIAINQHNIFNACLEYLEGDYAGYFMYYGKTIEDHFKLNYKIEDSLVKIFGKGMNNLGSFSITGYMNFYRSKELLIEKNNIDESFIKLAEFKMYKTYRDFNPTENERVIKSYNHRRKKNESDLDY